ncbi:MAG TPA: DEAD/DEAH box helicase [Candidatus Obscuribacterales bacterium]
MNSFAELGLSKQALACLSSINFSEPTEIQVKAIGPMLEGRDVMASAQTGSGKTAAYVLPIIDRLQTHRRACRALVLVPTRELALQVKVEFDRFGANAQLRTCVLYGGAGYDKQTRELRAGPDVIVATPGRLNDFLARRMVDLSKIETLVLDEADRLLDLGFAPQIRKIVDRIPLKRQTALFSATFDLRVERLSKEYMFEPVRVAARAARIEPSSIDQKFHKTSETEKEALLLKLIGDAGEGSVLVFTKTRRKATKVAARLRAASVEAHEIHGDVSQNKRELTLDRYRKGKFSVLVATDVAARGLDIPSISHVVNYDLPQSPADYVHRIGRTGRAGRAGCSHTFVCEADGGSLREIEKIVGRTLMNRPAAAVPAPQAKRAPRRFGRRANSPR